MFFCETLVVGPVINTPRTPPIMVNWHWSVVSFVRMGTFPVKQLFADYTNGRPYTTLLRPSVVCDVMYCG